METPFLHNEIWHVSIICPVHGEVEDEVPFAEAKRPRAAALIVQAKHEPCFIAHGVEVTAASAATEIAAASSLVEQQEQNLARVRTTLQAWLDKKDKTSADLKSIAEAEQMLEKHQKGLYHARRRLDMTKAQNSPLAE